jgi:hypothetical protein
VRVVLLLVVVLEEREEEKECNVTVPMGIEVGVWGGGRVVEGKGWMREMVVVDLVVVSEYMGIV